MAYVSDAAPHATALPTNSRPRGFFTRVWNALMASRLDQMDKIAAIYLESNGGTLTDDAEREIERRYSSHTFH